LSTRLPDLELEALAGSTGHDVFLTALLMVEPYELHEPTPQLAVTSSDQMGGVVPADWNGIVKAEAPASTVARSWSLMKGYRRSNGLARQV
jgi:hypothetical protein